jgi:hypothetical protein
MRVLGEGVQENNRSLGNAEHVTRRDKDGVVSKVGRSRAELGDDWQAPYAPATRTTSHGRTYSRVATPARELR